MARQLRIQYPDAYYHITCRGNERKKIFLDETDRVIFFERLIRSLDIHNVRLLSYVLMPNHFHLLLTTPEGNLSEFMRHFNISYTASFNRRHHRAGHLYQGRYKSYLIDADQYLCEVSRYIHLNPVRMSSLSRQSGEKKWAALLKDDTSSLSGFLSIRKRKSFVDYGKILEYFGGDNPKGRKEYGNFVEAGIIDQRDNPLNMAKGSGIVGSVDFINWVKRRFMKEERPVREQPAMRELKKEFIPDELIKRFSAITKAQNLLQRGKQSTERSMLMELLYRLCRITQPEIGKLVGGIDYSAVSQARKRFQQKLLEDQQLNEKFNSIQKKLCKMSRVKI